MRKCGSNWAKTLGRSVNRHLVFDQINKGKRAVWSAQEIATAQGLDLKAVLTEGQKLFDGEVVTREPGLPVRYRKRSIVQRNKRKIKEIALSKGKRKKAENALKPTVHVTVNQGAKLRSAKATFISADQIEQFRLMRTVPRSQISRNSAVPPLSEEAFKLGIIKLIGEPYELKDWGGEQLDIFSTRPKVKGTRRTTGFALKGPGSASGMLTPAKMGKNGDQIQRLIDDSISVAVVQYEGQVGQSIFNLMARLSGHKAHQSGSDFLYTVIDRDDSLRLRLAYPKQFTAAEKEADIRKFAKRVKRTK